MKYEIVDLDGKTTTHRVRNGADLTIVKDANEEFIRITHGKNKIRVEILRPLITINLDDAALAWLIKQRGGLPL